MSDAMSDSASDPESGARSAMELFAEGPLDDLDSATLRRLFERSPEDASDVSTTVGQLIADVRDRGDAALVAMAKRFDGVELTAIEVPRDRWDTAVQALPVDVRQALSREVFPPRRGPTCRPAPGDERQIRFRSGISLDRFPLFFQKESRQGQI